MISQKNFIATGVLGAEPLGEGVMEGSTGSPTFSMALPVKTEIRGRLSPSSGLITGDSRSSRK
jgi:hypothetical protein